MQRAHGTLQLPGGGARTQAAKTLARGRKVHARWRAATRTPAGAAPERAAATQHATAARYAKAGAGGVCAAAASAHGVPMQRWREKAHHSISLGIVARRRQAHDGAPPPCLHRRQRLRSLQHALRPPLFSTSPTRAPRRKRQRRSLGRGCCRRHMWRRRRQRRRRQRRRRHRRRQRRARRRRSAAGGRKRGHAGRRGRRGARDRNGSSAQRGHRDSGGRRGSSGGCSGAPRPRLRVLVP